MEFENSSTSVNICTSKYLEDEKVKSWCYLNYNALEKKKISIMILRSDLAFKVSR